MNWQKAAMVIDAEGTKERIVNAARSHRGRYTQTIAINGRGQKEEVEVRRQSALLQSRRGKRQRQSAAAKVEDEVLLLHWCGSTRRF